MQSVYGSVFPCIKLAVKSRRPDFYESKILFVKPQLLCQSPLVAIQILGLYLIL